MKRATLLSSLLALTLFISACNRKPEPEEELNPDTAPFTQQEDVLQTELPPRPARVSPRPDVVTDRFAILALDCIHRPYPNKIGHVMQSDLDMGLPRNMTPAFYGCFDWHSAVHGHWLLVRILKTDPATPLAPEIRAALNQSFTAQNLAAELNYLSAGGRSGFERPYGLAWYLQLVAELDESNDPDLARWRETLRPLEEHIVGNVQAWLPPLAYPIRVGTHNQSAFAFGLMLDYARTVENTQLTAALTQKTLGFHQNDTNCPLSYEPSGEDFLSPCLMEADLMRRILPPEAFSLWLDNFLPDIPTTERDDWLEPGIVLNKRDGKLVHLDGVNLSRAWALEGIASGLETSDPRRPALLAAAKRHKKIGIAAISDKHYSGSHWLASFATYLETKRGLDVIPNENAHESE